MTEQILSVSEVNRYTAELLATEPLLRDVQVRGEISGGRRYPSGHYYFNLKDEKASISCVMFKYAVSMLRFQPQDGQQVVAAAKAGLYERDGRFQLQVRLLQLDGQGQLYQRFEALKRQLEAEGLFDPSRKRPIPKKPRLIGVVTSSAGAVIRDIIQVSRRRYPGFALQLVPVLVQGPLAAGQIARAIDVLNDRREVDVILIGRGGGSIEDLWAFNEEVVARAIARSGIPVVSAVGHETDFTIADFVADLRAPTPSAAAELIWPRQLDLQQHVQQLRARLIRNLQQYIQRRRLILQSSRNRPVLQDPLQSVYQRGQRLDNLQQRLVRALRQSLQTRRHGQQTLAVRLQALNPQAVLTRGYAMVFDASGQQILSRVDDLKTQAAVLIQVQDGVVKATVQGEEVK